MEVGMMKKPQPFRNALFLSLLLVFCVYLRTLFQQPFADDEIYLAFSNSLLRQAPFSELYRLFLEPANPWEFLPLRDFTYWLDFRLFGDEFVGFHASNLVWYALSLAGAFCFFRESIVFCRPDWKERAGLLSLAGALLFAAHPAHVEVAAWVASRKDLIAGTLGFFSFALLINAMREDGTRRRYGKIVASALLLFLACFGKASATAYVVVASTILCAGIRTSKNRGEKFGSLFLFWGLIGLACVIHAKIGRSTGIHIENAPGVFAMIDRASRITSALSGILVFPWPMRFYYDVYLLGNWHWVFSVGALALSLLAFHRLTKKPELWALGAVLVFSPMAIYLQFAPFSTWSLASERFVFVSVAGLSLLLIDFLGRMTKPGVIGACVAALVLPCTLVTWQRIDAWDGLGNALLDAEYRYQPEFHNAIRDRILFTLIPEKRHDEARTLSKRLRRDYGVDAMLKMIDADLAYAPFRERSPSEIDDGDAAPKFCETSARLRESIAAGRKRMLTEADISYNSILNMLERAQKFRFGNEKLICPVKIK
jgi:hypothetical protein